MLFCLEHFDCCEEYYANNPDGERDSIHAIQIQGLRERHLSAIILDTVPMRIQTPQLLGRLLDYNACPSDTLLNDLESPR